MKNILLAFLIHTNLVFISCGQTPNKKTLNAGSASVTLAANHNAKDSAVYSSQDLIILQLSENVFVHQSFLQTQTFGKVSCNGMLVVNDNQAVIFDTPTDNQTSKELIRFVKENLKSEIKAVVATHFHGDCTGGLNAFHEENIPSYANQKTLELLRNEEEGTPLPENGFDGMLTLNIGNEKVYAEFFGEGHTKDNVIGHFPKEKAIFGGCLIKETGATKGFTGDANVQAWPETVTKLKEKYPDTRIVIPGHGKSGGTELLDYTIELFK